LKFVLSLARKTTTQGFTLLELLVVLCIIGILSTIALASYLSIIRKVSCIAREGDLPGLCWPESKKWGGCWVASPDCFFPRPGARSGDVYSQPRGYKEVKGFYVNLTTPNSAATLTYKAYPCSDSGSVLSDSKYIESSIAGSEYLDTRSNYISFPKGICGFEIYLIQKLRTDGNRIYFDMNFAVD
jgi:prepilin-type N-terminal cleavage/methylation domain-containing protein